MLVILTDNTGTIFNRANIKQESLAELNRIASEATGGNTWWEPDLSEEEVSRECRGCGRIMSRREASEQHACNDCATGERR